MKTLNSPQLLIRLRHARDACKMSQDELAAKMGFADRQVVSAIEKGKRALKVPELIQFASIVGRDVDFFTDPFNVVAEAEYCWRASPDLHETVLDSFEEQANKWVGLLRWLRAKHQILPRSKRETLNITVESSFERAQYLAEEYAESERLGNAPAENLPKFIEEELGIPVLFVDGASSSGKKVISGAACRLVELDVILVNRNETAARRNFDLAHELFHLLTWKEMKPAHRESNSAEHRKGAARVEQLADNFAAALLMPQKSLDFFIKPELDNDIRHLEDVAKQLKVSPSALSWRLKSLGLLSEADRAQLAAVPVGRRTEAPKRFSESFVTQLHGALDNGWLSVRKAASTLGLTVYELNALFTEYKFKTFDL